MQNILWNDAYDFQKELSLKQDDTIFNFKNISIDLFKLAYDIANNNLADLIEIFRLEGLLIPIIMKQPSSMFHDNYQDNILRAWENQINNQLEKKLPLISQLPLSNLQTFWQIKIAFKDDNLYDFHYIDSKKYIKSNNEIDFKTSSKKNIINSQSPNALLYHAINMACLLKSDIFYTIHYTKAPTIFFQGWYGIHIPFENDIHHGFKKGIISLIRKI